MESLKPLDSGQLTEISNKFSPFLKEIRKRIVFTFTAFCVSAISGFIFYEKIIKFLVGLLSLKGVNIVFTSPFQFINLAFSCGAATGLVIVMPLIIFQVLFFLKPALKKKEYRIVLGLLPFCILLFIIGFVFGLVIMRWQIEIFLARSIALGIGNILDISGLLSTVLLTSVLMGVGFQFPVILLLLMKIKLITYQKLSSKRKWIYLGSVLFAFLLPPDSILADILLSLPLIILFESTLILYKVLGGKKS